MCVTEFAHKEAKPLVWIIRCSSLEAQWHSGQSIQLPQCSLRVQLPAGSWARFTQSYTFEVDKMTNKLTWEQYTKGPTLGISHTEMIGEKWSTTSEKKPVETKEEAVSNLFLLFFSHEIEWHISCVAIVYDSP